MASMPTQAAAAPHRRQPGSHRLALGAAALPAVLIALVLLAAMPARVQAHTLDMSSIVDQIKKGYQSKGQMEADEMLKIANEGAAKEAAKAQKEADEKADADAVDIFFRVESEVPTHSYNVRERFLHDPMAFTQGLEVADDGNLWESVGLYGRSALKKTKISGHPIKATSMKKKLFGEGLTKWRDKVVVLTWREKQALMYDKDTMEHVGGFKINFEGWGLTHDDSGEVLYASEGTNRIIKIDPPPKGWKEDDEGAFKLTNKKGEEIASVLWRTPEGRIIKIPVRLNELEWVEGEIWANLWPTETIVRMKPGTGELLGWVDLRGLKAEAEAMPNNFPVCRMDVLNGIAYTNNSGAPTFYVTGKCWPRLWDLEILEREECGVKGEILAAPEEEIKYVREYDFYQVKEQED